MRFAVRDTGPGVPPEALTRIFSEFEQANQSRDEAMGGIGLGLAVTRRLVKLHGGEIGVESKPGEGSTFWFTLPRKGSPQESSDVPELPDKLELRPNPGDAETEYTQRPSEDEDGAPLVPVIPRQEAGSRERAR